MQKILFWEALQGRDAPGSAPAGFDTAALTVQLSAFPGQFWFSPENAKGTDQEQHSDIPPVTGPQRLLEWTSPAPHIQFSEFDAEGYKYGFRLVQQSMQRSPRGRSYALPRQETFSVSNGDVGLPTSLCPLGDF